MKTLALVLIFASFAQAEVPSRIVLWGGATADLLSTRMAIKQGAVEANPVVGQSLKRQAAVMYSLTALSEILATAASRAGHPKMGKIARYLTGGGHFGAAAWNVHVWRSLH